MRFVQVNGLKIGYDQVGDGSPLVLVHGAGDDSRIWRPQLAALADEYMVIAWDEPGAGRSADVPPNFTLAGYASCLAGLIKRLGVGPVHLCGLSWGGAVALQIYADHPYLVKDLVFADTYAGWKGSLSHDELQARISGSRCMLGTSQADFDPNLRGLFAGLPPNSAMSLLTEIAKDVRRNSLATQLAAIADADLTGALHHVGVPTLLIWGERDERSPLSVARQFARLIPHATLVVIPNCGHLSNLQRPREFNEAVRAFCRANA